MGKVLIVGLALWAAGCSRTNCVAVRTADGAETRYEIPAGKRLMATTEVSLSGRQMTTIKIEEQKLSERIMEVVATHGIPAVIQGLFSGMGSTAAK